MAYSDYEMARNYLERSAHLAAERLEAAIIANPAVMCECQKTQEILDRTLPPKDDQDSSSN